MSVLKSVMARKSVYQPFKESVLSSDSLFGMKNNWTTYICCFCSAGEQAYMWKGYASDGTGCALVFDYGALFSGAQDGKRYGFFRVMYDRESQIRQIVAAEKPRVSVAFDGSSLKRVIRGPAA
jgi:DUF2971 family protein